MVENREAVVSAELPSHWLNVVVEAERIKAGDYISVQVEGGWVRRQVPCDGTVYYTRSGDKFFLPMQRRLSKAVVSSEIEENDGNGSAQQG